MASRAEALSDSPRGAIKSELSRLLHNTNLAAMAKEVGLVDAAPARPVEPVLPTAPASVGQFTSSPSTPRKTAPRPAAVATPSPAKRKIDMQSPDDEGKRKRGRAGAAPAADKNGRGLRHFSLQVCQKVREKGVTTYNEGLEEGQAQELDEDGNELHGPKNIRRRVYDALNVLMAMNIIAKDRKDIRWIGLPTSAAQELARLQDQQRALQTRLEEKRKKLHELMLQQIAFKSLLRRNEREPGDDGDPRIQLPFVVVQTHRETVIQCQMTEDKSEYVFDFNRPFSIHDDVEVLKRLGLALGLDTGTATEAQIEEARTMVPHALQGHITELVEARRRQR